MLRLIGYCLLLFPLIATCTSSIILSDILFPTRYTNSSAWTSCTGLSNLNGYGNYFTSSYDAKVMLNVSSPDSNQNIYMLVYDSGNPMILGFNYQYKSYVLPTFTMWNSSFQPSVIRLIGDVNLDGIYDLAVAFPARQVVMIIQLTLWQAPTQQICQSRSSSPKFSSLLLELYPSTAVFGPSFSTVSPSSIPNFGQSVFTMGDGDKNGIPDIMIVTGTSYINVFLQYNKKTSKLSVLNWVIPSPGKSLIQ